MLVLLKIPDFEVLSDDAETVSTIIIERLKDLGYKMQKLQNMKLLMKLFQHIIKFILKMKLYVLFMKQLLVIVIMKLLLIQ